MSRLLVFTFESPEEASRARGALKDLEKSHALGLDDALVLVKDANGQIHRQREPSHAMVIGAIVGGLMGLLFIFMFPVISVIFGAAAGALIGRLLIDQRVDEEFIVDAERALPPNSSALLLLIRTGDIAELGTSLRAFPLHIYQTSLAPDLEATLRQAYGEEPNSSALNPGSTQSRNPGAQTKGFETVTDNGHGDPAAAAQHTTIDQNQG